MLIYKHECLDRLFKYEKDNNCQHLIKETIDNDYPSEKVIKFLVDKNEELPVVEHYSLLNKKVKGIILKTSLHFLFNFLTLIICL